MSRRINVDVKELFRLWHTTMRNDQLAAALGVTRGNLASLRDRFGLPVRDFALRAPMGNASHKPDPTEDEIAERAAQVRMSWSREEEERRWCHGRRGVTVQQFAYNGRDVAFSGLDG